MGSRRSVLEGFFAEMATYRNEKDEESVDDTTQCTICLESMVDNSHIITTNCKHFFHRDCLLDWMVRDHDDCPTCRTTLLTDDVAAKLHTALAQPSRILPNHGVTTTPQDHIASYCCIALIFLLQGVGILIAISSYLNALWFK